MLPETTMAVTLGEISRGVNAAREEIAKVQEGLEARPDWEDVKRVERGLELQIQAAVTESKTRDALQDLAIGKLEGWGNWATKAVGGLVIAAVLVRSGMG